MSMTDPVADLLTRIRNAQRAGLEELDLPASNIKQRICEVLRDEGFVREVSRTDDGRQGTLKVLLKYDEGRRPAISEIRRQSKPGLRRYVRYTEIPKVMNGLGIAILSTSKGVLVDREARKQHLGGTQGFSRSLDIAGVGYKAELKGREIHLALGFSHPVVYPLPEGVTAEYDAKGNRLTVKGADKHRIGLVAAEIRKLRPPEPYKGKGIKYAEETIRRKQGKTGAA